MVPQTAQTAPIAWEYWINPQMRERRQAGGYQAWEPTWLGGNVEYRAAIALRMEAAGWERTDRATYRRFSRRAYKRFHKAQQKQNGAK